MNADRLSVDPRIAVTQMVCEDPITEQERRFLDALSGATAWRADNDTRVIDGPVRLTARRSPQAE